MVFIFIFAQFQMPRLAFKLYRSITLLLLAEKKMGLFPVGNVVMVGFVDDTVNDGNNCCRNAGKENVFVSQRE